jgi:carbonic anhydrase
MINDDLCLNVIGEIKPTIIERIVNQPIILIPLPSRHCNENWDYKVHGGDWECDCSEGKEQSPIDLPPTEKAILSPIKPLFQYDETNVKVTFSTLDGQLNENTNVKIKNIDNSLRIFHKYFGKIVTLDGAVYNAEEIVFHTPAEHLINGRRYEMEMQVIHYGQTKGDIAKQVVLSFVFERKPGIYNKFIDDIDFFNLPNPIIKERDLQNNIFIPKVFYSADDDNLPIMRPFSFYTYQGSISFPPCTERTINYVAAQPIQLGSTALQLFQEALRIPDFVTQTGDVIVSNSIDQNYRKVQPVNGRPIFYYDHIKYCGPEPPVKIIKPSGHYEKVIKEATKYFYVNGPEPSGLPGSFVVSTKEAKGDNLG